MLRDEILLAGLCVQYMGGDEDGAVNLSGENLEYKRGLRRVLNILCLRFSYSPYRWREIFCFRAFICRLTDGGKIFYYQRVEVKN